MKGKSLSRAQLLATPWTAAYQAPPSMGLSRQEYWSGLPLPSPYDSEFIANSWKPSMLLLYTYIIPLKHSIICELNSEKVMATHSSTLAWKIPWTEGPDGLQSMGLLGVGHD